VHYIFYETGNDVFFSRIADAFCSALGKYIADRYNEFLKPDSNIIDHDTIKFFWETDRSAINPLSCALFCDCGNQQCRNNYKAVLASDQVERLLWSMEHTIKAFYRKSKYIIKTRERLNYQIILQHYLFVRSMAVEEINIAGRGKPIEYKCSNLARYKRLYAAGARKLMKKRADMDAETFVYIRAPTGSHYDYFARETGLPNLRPCDFLQQIE
jgi:hypothetical protein